MLFLLFLSFLLLIHIQPTSANGSRSATTTVNVYHRNGNFSLVFGEQSDASAVAAGSLSDQNEGWFVLNVRAGSATTMTVEKDRIAFQAAGIAEAVLTCESIALFSLNNDDATTSSPKLQEFLRENDAWMKKQIAAHASSVEYWRAIGNIYAQFDGIVHGFNTWCPNRTAHFKPLTRTEMLFMQMDGDLEDLSVAFGTSPTRRSKLGLAATGSPGLRCSALVKINDDGSDIFFGHATWDSYSNMAPRIFKHMHVPTVRDSKRMIHHVSFSSSPSWLASIDDYYLVNGTATLGITETSHSILNKHLYSKLTPESVLCWLRVVVANQLAVNGSDWARIFSTHASGTYNNEWQVVDLQKFKPGAKNLSPGLLTVLEEVPGLVHWEDLTAKLQDDTYFPSFNVPYFPLVQAAAGYSNRDWTHAPRNCLFESLQSSVQSVHAMGSVMRWNDYRHSRCSHDSPDNAIAARGDLSLLVSSAFGALDAKWSNFLGGVQMRSYAQAGPTHDNQKVFCWKGQMARANPHHGHPECFNFSTIAMTPDPTISHTV